MDHGHVPESRIHGDENAVRRGGDYVLYWMIGSRRTRENFALERAADWASHLGKPLVILEPLRAGYRWASDRHHTFVIQGMADNAAALAVTPARYLAYLEPTPGAGKGLLAALAERACLVVTDETPVFFLPRMVAAAREQLDCRIEAIDSVGLLPFTAAPRPFTTAYSFRRHLHKNLPEHLLEPMPTARPLEARDLPEAPDLGDVLEPWDMVPHDRLANPAALVAELPIDHDVGPGAQVGGSVAAEEVLERFLAERLEKYAEGRSHPDDPVASELSSYLHWGHLSTHRVFQAVTDDEGWHPGKLAGTTKGQRQGWWGMSEAAESFLDELVTWREVGQTFAYRQPDCEEYETLPEWARVTLEEHAGDPRPQLYSLAEFDESRTHDEIWNAAQRQLKQTGQMPNYLRMLWGKKVLHWSESPREALDILLELNNKYALDGRDPNSMSGITWVLGRFDRAWGPEREVFGKIRYMTSDSTRRKLKLKRWLAEWGDAPRLPFAAANEEPRA